MTGEIEAAGELVTGGLLGRAVEPSAGEHGGEGHPELCLNCGTRLQGPHCHQCGQTGHVHRSLGAIGHEILHGVVHFEGKLWRTLPMLAFRPGELTRRYIAGERARFVSPMALFLFSVFTMFAVFQMLGVSAPTELNAQVSIQAAIDMQRKEVITDRDEARADLADPDTPAARRETLKTDIAQLDEELKALDEAKAGIAAQPGLKVSFDDVHTGSHFIDHAIEKVRKNPSLALYKLQSNSYKFSWALIPLSLPFVWLLFAWRRQFHLYDHAVFITYSIAFMSLFFILISLLGAAHAPVQMIAIGAVFIPPFHLYKQLKGAYRLRRFPAALRTIVLLWFITIIAVLFISGIFALGAMG